MGDAARAISDVHDRAEAPDAISRLSEREDFVVLCAKILERARDDLRRPPGCGHYETAVAWIVGRYPCGCRYAGAGPSFEDVCSTLFPDPSFAELARERLLRGVEIKTNRRQCRQRSE